jgi:hypothetical protein
MTDQAAIESAAASRRGFGLAAAGLVLSAAALVPGAALAAEPPPLQVSYSTDPHMTCDALQEESARMDVILGTGATAALARTARERKQRLGEILKNKSCAPAPAKAFGPDMYDLPGTAPVRR